MPSVRATALLKAKPPPEKGIQCHDEENGQQAVIALAEGDEQRVMRFCNLALTKHTQQALVDNVKSEDYTGDVLPLWQFALINIAYQMNKAIPALLKIQDNTNVTP